MTSENCLEVWLPNGSHASGKVGSRFVSSCIIVLLACTFACQTGDYRQTNDVEQSISRIFKSQGTTLSNEKAIRKVFDLDSVTKTQTSAARYFWDKVEGKGLMFHLNNLTNSIYIYDFERGSLLNVIELSKDGPDGVGKVSGFEVLNRDSILVLDRYKYQVTIVDDILSQPQVRSRYYLKSGNESTEYTAICNNLSRIYLIDGVLWFATVPFLYTSDNVHQKGVSLVSFDLKTFESKYFKLFPQEYNTTFSQSFKYPSIAKLNKKKLVISFPASSKLFVFDTELETLKEHDIPSKHVLKTEGYKGRDNDNDLQNVHYNRQASFSRLLFSEKNRTLYRFFRTPNRKLAELYDWKSEISFYGVQIISDRMVLEREVERVADSSFFPIILAQDGLYIQDFIYIDSIGKPNENKMSYLKLFFDDE